MWSADVMESLREEEHVILLARLGGTWSIASSVAEAEKADHLTLPDALSILQKSNIDLMQPHMYCYRGMVKMRSIADMLDIPLLGSPGHVMALTTNKWQARAVVESVGVPVPKAQLLRRGDSITMQPPFMLKPCREDNSMGVNLVQQWEDVEQALATAFRFDDLVICEEFIPLGREVRVAVVETPDGKSLEVLPLIEYLLGKNKLPIRTSVDKIPANNDGSNKRLLLASPDYKIITDTDERLLAKLTNLAVMSHRVLGCEHYSLYDVRIDPDGNPFFIEAGGYCSFSPRSAIVRMSRGNPEYNDTDLFYRFASKAIKNYGPNPTSMKEHGEDMSKRSFGMRVCA